MCLAGTWAKGRMRIRHIVRAVEPADASPMAGRHGAAVRVDWRRAGSCVPSRRCRGNPRSRARAGRDVRDTRGDRHLLSWDSGELLPGRPKAPPYVRPVSGRDGDKPPTARHFSALFQLSAALVVPTRSGTQQSRWCPTSNVRAFSLATLVVAFLSGPACRIKERLLDACHKGFVHVEREGLPDDEMRRYYDLILRSITTVPGEKRGSFAAPSR